MKKKNEEKNEENLMKNGGEKVVGMRVWREFRG